MDELARFKTNDLVSQLTHVIEEKQLIIQRILSANEKEKTTLYIIDQEINRLFNQLRIIDLQNDDFLMRLLEEQINYFSASHLNNQSIEIFNKADHRLYQLIHNLQYLEKDINIRLTS